MSLDAIPSGFSSAAAVTLLKTMRSTQSANISFIAGAGSSSIQASSKSTISGDTIFSIIAAAAKSRSTDGSASATHASAPQSDTSSGDPFSTTTDDIQAVGGAQALADDPYFQKSYSIDQAAQNWYASMNRTAVALRNTDGQARSGQTNGQTIASLLQFTGDQAIIFAAKFDRKTLTVHDSTALGVATNQRTWITDGSGGVIGYSTTGHVNGEAMTKWRQDNPNSLLTDDEGYRGGALLLSW